LFDGKLSNREIVQWPHRLCIFDTVDRIKMLSCFLKATDLTQKMAISLYSLTVNFCRLKKLGKWLLLQADLTILQVA